VDHLQVERWVLGQVCHGLPETCRPPPLVRPHVPLEPTLPVALIAKEGVCARASIGLDQVALVVLQRLRQVDGGGEDFLEVVANPRAQLAVVHEGRGHDRVFNGVGARRGLGKDVRRHRVAKDASDGFFRRASLGGDVSVAGIAGERNGIPEV